MPNLSEVSTEITIALILFVGGFAWNRISKFFTKLNTTLSDQGKSIDRLSDKTDTLSVKFDASEQARIQGGEKMTLVLKGLRTTTKGTLASLEAIHCGHVNGNVDSAIKDLKEYDDEIYAYLSKEGNSYS